MFETGILAERLNGWMGSMGSIGFDFLVFVIIGFIISCSGTWSSFSYLLLGIGILGERLNGSTYSTSSSSSSTASIKLSSLFKKLSSVILSLLSPTLNKSEPKII